MYLLLQVQHGCRCILQVTGVRWRQERGLGDILAGFFCGVLKFDSYECIDPVVGGFDPPLDPLEEQLYILIQVDRGST